MAGLGDPRQLLDVDMGQIAGRRMFIAHHRPYRLQHRYLVQLEPNQGPAHGCAAQAGGLGDAYAGPALSPKQFNDGRQLRRNATWGSMGAGQSARGNTKMRPCRFSLFMVPLEKLILEAELNPSKSPNSLHKYQV